MLSASLTPFSRQGPFDNLAESVAALAAAPLLYAPGSQWSYGPGHDVLGRLVEVWTGVPYADFLRDEVKSTGFFFTPRRG